MRTVAIASGKGGVGKSNLAANLAVALGALGARVLLLDADFAQANLDLLLGLHPRFDLQHVVRGEKTIEEMMGGINEVERALITGGNAARIWDLHE